MERRLQRELTVAQQEMALLRQRLQVSRAQGQVHSIRDQDRLHHCALVAAPLSTHLSAALH